MGKLISFQVQVFDRLNDLYPELRLKEYMIGISVKCDLLLPLIPRTEQGQDEISIIKRSGFRLD